MSPSYSLVSIRIAVALLAATTALGLPVAAAAARPYAPGEEVEISGVVSDASGQPLAGLEVVLTGYRKSFDVWSFQSRRRGDSALTATTDEKGGFTIRWKWDKFYNRFHLVAGIRKGASGEDDWWRVAELDLTRAMKRGSPVVAHPLVAAPEEVRSLQAFVASLNSTDTRRVYQELGKPDKVKSVELADHREVTWWYFDRGMLYRFVDGRLESSTSFEPVPQLENTEP